MDKNTELFESACEYEKLSFNAAVTSLLELHSFISQKRQQSINNGKDGAWVTNKELAGMEEWILRASTKLLGAYDVLDRTNRNAFQLHRCGVKIREKQTPDLKKLLS